MKPKKSQWHIIKNAVTNKLNTTFRANPHCFFSEHDIHSVLYNLTQEQLKQFETHAQTTLDGFKTTLTHHEYPTPFRCDMQGYNFRRVSEEKRTPKGGLYKRGHYDLVILNPDFIKNNPLDIVCGKNYKKLQPILRKNVYASINLGLRNYLFPKNQKTTRKRN